MTLNITTAELLRAFTLVDALRGPIEAGRDFEDGSIVVFYKRFDGSEKTYVYTATKAEGYWHWCGRKGDWIDLIVHLCDKAAALKCYRVSEIEEVEL